MSTKNKSKSAGQVKSLAGAAAALTLAAALAGCSTLEQAAPDSVSVVMDHTSHILQHPPFAEVIDVDPTNYGYDDLSLQIRWQSGPLWLEMSDGYELLSGYQSLPGPREIFHASMGLELWHKAGAQ